MGDTRKTSGPFGLPPPHHNTCPFLEILSVSRRGFFVASNFPEESAVQNLISPPPATIQDFDRHCETSVRPSLNKDAEGWEESGQSVGKSWPRRAGPRTAGTTVDSTGGTSGRDSARTVGNRLR